MSKRSRFEEAKLCATFFFGGGGGSLGECRGISKVFREKNTLTFCAVRRQSLVKYN